MRERIRFDLPFQRNSVWKNDRRSYLVDSVIRDKYIPNILVWDNGDGYIWVVDGRQRWESIFFFADGDYKLSKGTADFNSPLPRQIAIGMWMSSLSGSSLLQLPNKTLILGERV